MNSYPTKGQMQSIGDVLKQIIQEKKWEDRFKTYAVWDYWDEIVGEMVARQAHPKSFRQGCLWIGVSDPIWMHHLQVSKEAIRERLNQRIGSPVIKDIRFSLVNPLHKETASGENAADPPRE